jgi:hypothetical protein
VRFVVAGASGFLGRALTARLHQSGHEVVALVRRPAHGSHESTWDPYGDHVDGDLIASADVVVNLAGAATAHWPWTAGYAHKFAESRIRTTRLLAETIAASGTTPAFLAQNGIAGYGDTAGEPAGEDYPQESESVLGKVTIAWAEATHEAVAAGSRVVVLRTSIVLDGSSMPMSLLTPLFKAGLGGRLGDGSQYFSTISLRDWLAAAQRVAEDDSFSGPVNLAGPDPVTNAEFTRALARAVHRPAVIPVPAWPMRRLAGAVADEVLTSTRVVPTRLLEAGFEFADPDIDSQIATALGHTGMA